MNYIYDILANFNEYFYEFFEWEKNDNIIHIKKIPIIKINKSDYKKIVQHNFKIDNSLLKRIENKTEVLNKNKNYKYTLLITNGKDIIGVKFDNQGNTYERSSLQIEDELDNLETIKNMEIKKIKYILKNKIIYSFNTRIENKNKSFLLNEIKKLSIINDKDKISYLYFECFNKKENNRKFALKKIYENINMTNISNTLYNIFNINKTSIK